MPSREFTNNLSDYVPNFTASHYLSDDGQSLSDEWKAKITAKINELTVRLEHGLRTDANQRDGTVYTGSAGIALLFYSMYQKLDKQLSTEWLIKAEEYARHAVSNAGHREISFLCGSAGAAAVASAVYTKLGKHNEAKRCYELVVNMSNNVVDNETVPDELLFGRSGYLYSLMFLARECPNVQNLEENMQSVMQAIVESGVDLSKEMRFAHCPLMYVWHKTIYLGAAHGLAGIFFTLMRTPMFDDYQAAKELVEKSIDYLMTIRYPSGNFPSSLREGGSDKLVHWCHGAPGFIHMFLQAYKVYGKQQYLDQAISCGEVIWVRGLLRKGYGLCHGVAGNGYAFLMLYQTTRELRYLHRALKFAEFIFDYGKHGCRIADSPFSLFEGMAGTIYYLVDLLNPMQASFPAFY